ncbi:MAG TPA: peptidoglycan DD-metalloendopeptidase family protein [Candidatus Limnocylindrales bacterium]
MSGWTSVAGPPSRRRRLGRRLGFLLLLFPLIVGVIGAPVNVPSVHGDELSAARARQAQLRKDVAAQRARIARLAAIQASLSADIQDTAVQLRGVNADLAQVKKKITTLQTRIDAVQGDYVDLVAELADLDSQLLQVEAQEAAKRAELSARRAQLAERIRDAYDSDRTSLLESFLSAGSFTDVLAEMSYYIDTGEQDKALAQQIATDQATLAEIHQTVSDTRDRTNELRLATAATKRSLDRSLSDLNDARASLKTLERKTAVALARQKAAYATAIKNKAAAAAALAKAAAAQKRLENRIASILRRGRYGRIPSRYNGTLSWPMPGVVTQNFGCTGFRWEPPLGNCRNFHRGIDVVAPIGAPVRAAGDGIIVYVGWNYADGADPAWIVIIAHSQSLQTWYAHMAPTRPPGIRTGSRVSKGQVIGYEGNTGRSTGAHLHWAAYSNGRFVNPRLYL